MKREHVTNQVSIVLLGTKKFAICPQLNSLILESNQADRFFGSLTALQSFVFQNQSSFFPEPGSLVFLWAGLVFFFVFRTSFARNFLFRFPREILFHALSFVFAICALSAIAGRSKNPFIRSPTATYLRD